MNKVCPFCSKEVEEENDVCPHCGKSLKEEEVLEASNEDVISTPEVDVEDVKEVQETQELQETKEEHEVQEPQVPQETKEEQEVQEVQEVQEPKEAQAEKPLDKERTSGKNKKTLIIGAVIGLVALIAIAFGVKSYMEKKAHEEYVKEYNAYVDLVKQTQLDMLNGAVQVETRSNGLVKVWSNAIWKTDDADTDPYTKVGGVFVSDFNTAISNYLYSPDTIKVEVAIESSQEKVSDAIKKLKNPPVGLEAHHEEISEMYDLFMEFSNLGLNPTGSLTTYRQSISSLDTKVVSSYDKVGRLDFTKIE